jgi:hypothetical protein
MHNFKDFGIKIEAKGFIGDKISIDRLLNKPITVITYKIEKSKFKTTECLHLQLEVDNQKRVMFIGSSNLIKMIEQVPKDKFPFNTMIVKEGFTFQFT